MLVRGANAVGYMTSGQCRQKLYRPLGQERHRRLPRFDSLNSLDNMYGTIQAVRENNKLAEVALCYTGDILDPSRNNTTWHTMSIWLRN